MRELRVVDFVTQDTLAALIHGDIDLIWHEGFSKPKVYLAAKPRIMTACAASTYTLTKDLQCVGVSIGEAVESTEKARQYLEEAASTTAYMRDSLFAGAASPIDTLRLLVDKSWPAGADVARSHGRPVLPNVIRRWVAGGQANPHIDQRNSEVLGDYQFRKRLGVNVYLEVPPPGGGGDLELWDTIVDDEQSYVARKREDYGLNREDIDGPDWIVSPGDGDLIIFDAARVHGVRAISNGQRVTMACFLGARSLDEPLVFFA